MVNYYETSKGKVTAIIDMEEFRKYHPKVFLRPLSYDEFCKREKTDQLEGDEE